MKWSSTTAMFGLVVASAWFLHFGGIAGLSFAIACMCGAAIVLFAG